MSLKDKHGDLGLQIPKDVQKLSSDVLQNLIDRSTAVLMEREAQDRDESLLEIVELVKRNKIPFSDIVGMLQDSHAVFGNQSESGKQRKLYVDPDDSNNTWHGVGRRPVWVTQKVAQGIDIETLCVDVPDAQDQKEFFYYNPNNKKERWSGIGRKPNWFKQLEEQNIDVNQYKTLF